MSWRRNGPWLVVSLLTFVLGAAAMRAWLRQAAIQTNIVPQAPRSTDSPILAFCELANNPEKYTGRTVRVSAVLSGFIHGKVLNDPNCASIDTRTAVFFNTQNKEQIERDLKQARGSDDWLIPVYIIALGEFRRVVPSNESDTIYDSAPLQFEIIRVEKASKAR